MRRQGGIGIVGWWKDFWYGIQLAWTSAGAWQRVYQLERGQAGRWVRWSTTQSLGGLERRASEQRIDQKLAELDARKAAS